MSHGSPEELYARGRALLARGDPVAAMDPLREAAHAGHAEASHCLAMTLASEAKRLEEWEYVLAYTGRAAEAGHVLARRTLAFMVGDKNADTAILRGEALIEETWHRLHDAINLADWLKPPQKKLLRQSPHIAVLENFITPVMCDWICEQAMPRLQRVMIYDQAGTLQTHETRTNSDMRFTFPDTDLVLMLTANAISRATGGRFRDHEEAAVLHYTPGQEFKAHFDFLLPPHPGVKVRNQRRFTVLIYLNDDYEGGETLFPHLGFGIKGQKGGALMFRNLDENGQQDQRTLHAGSPTTRGEKRLFPMDPRAAELGARTGKVRNHSQLQAKFPEPSTAFSQPTIRPRHEGCFCCFSAANLPINPRCAPAMPAYTAPAKWNNGAAGGDGTGPEGSGRHGVRVMDKLLLEYLPILIFIGVAAVMGGALIVLPLLIAPSKPDPEKLSAYECGFPAFGDARMKFDVRFYLVAILFIIFDLEVAFLFPWAITLSDTGMFAFWSMMVFLGVLTVGFLYEWKKGALEWE